MNSVATTQVDKPEALGKVVLPQWAYAGFLFIAALFVYMNSLSVNYVLDFPAYYWPTIERGEWWTASFWGTNHLLHYPLEFSFYRVWQILGYTGNSILPTQTLSALAGALTVAFLFLSIVTITDNTSIALLLSVAAMFSRSLWVLSTDAYYQALYTAGITITIWVLSPLLVNKPVTRRRAVGLGIALGLTSVVAQWGVLTFPAIIIALLLTRSFVQPAARVVFSFVFGMITLGVVGFAYVIVGVYVGGAHSLIEILARGSSHPSLPQWGRLDIERFILAIPYIGGSMAPITEGIGLRALLRGGISLEKLIPQVAVLCFGLALIAIVIFTMKHGKQLWAEHKTLLAFCLAWAIPFWLFLAWYDYMSSAWFPFFLPFLLIVSSFASSFRLTINHIHYKIFLTVLMAGIIVLALGNYIAAIHPRHAQSNVLLEKALVAKTKMNDGDILISVKWDWPHYLAYFANRQQLDMTTWSRTPTSEVKDKICSVVEQTTRAGHRAYMVDTANYPSDIWQWLNSPTGIDLRFGSQDFGALARKPGWSFPDGKRVWELQRC